MFRVYSCDCVGFEVIAENGQRQAWCVESCDAGPEDDSPALYIRSGLLEKESVPLSPEKTITLLTRLARLIHRGHKFDAVQRLLGIG